MAEVNTSRIWLHQFVFAMLGCFIMFLQLLPMDMRPEAWPAPDLLLAVTLVWVARRPEYAPVTTIAVVFLLTDLFFQRPPGLWAGMVVILTEFVRARSGSVRNMPLMLEWGMAALGVVALTILYRIALTLVMIPQPPLGLSLIQMVMTILAYPLVVFVAHVLFGVTRPAPGAVDRLGHRI